MTENDYLSFIGAYGFCGAIYFSVAPRFIYWAFRPLIRRFVAPSEYYRQDYFIDEYCDSWSSWWFWSFGILHGCLVFAAAGTMK